MNKFGFHGVLCAFALISGLFDVAYGQTYDTLRVATYNLLNYPSDNSAARNPEFRKILRAIDPDVLVVQEMQSSAGVTEFLNQVLNLGQPGTYANAPFSNGPDTDNALFYKPSRVSFQSQVVLTTALRDINGYVIRPAGVTADSLDFRIYSAHLKASQGFEQDRLAECTILRNHLNSLGPGHYIVAGDLNLYTSTEPGYELLLENQADNDGRVYDVLNQPGSWHNNSNFAAVHTQSPRLTDLGDGGATGGLDDRFDFLLPTFPFQSLPSWQVLSGSYTEFGNDGAHFGQSVNNGTNFSVPDSIADALHVCSDHLPVFVEIRRQVTASPTVTLLQPNGGQSFGEGDTVSATWNTTSYSGTITLSLSRTGANGIYETLITGTANDGQYSWVAGGAPTTQARMKVILDGSPQTTDISNADFTLFDRDLSLFTPANGDSVNVGFGLDIQWTAINVSGNVRIELKRAPSSPGWEVITASTPSTGFYSWTATGPVTDSARVRVLVATAPSVGDTSGMFKIKSPATNVPPSITHHPICDALPGSVAFHCRVQDTGPYSAPYLIWTNNGFASRDSAQLGTAALGGYSISRTFSAGFYSYFLQVTDAGGLTARTDTFDFVVDALCPISIAYDDGSAEAYQWSESTGMSWAVRFTPPSQPFVLCAAEYAVSVRKPDSLHGLVTVSVLEANGSGGTPGDTLGQFTAGTLPNTLSGGAGTSPGWGNCVLREATGQPMVVSGDFYLAVTETRTAFALDASPSMSGRSYVWDACDGLWYPENGIAENSRLGDRIIRAQGYALLPPSLVISTSGNDAVLRWTDTGAPEYAIFRAVLPSGPFDVAIAVTVDTTWTDAGVIGGLGQAFYVVRSQVP